MVFEIYAKDDGTARGRWAWRLVIRRIPCTEVVSITTEVIIEDGNSYLSKTHAERAVREFRIAVAGAPMVYP